MPRDFLPKKKYRKWGQPQFVNGRWQIRRTYTRKGRKGVQGFDVYYLTKKR